MKFIKIIPVGLACLFILGACNNETTITYEEKTTPTEVQEEVATHKVVGNDVEGYIQIPTNFIERQETSANGKVTTLYGNQEETFAVGSIPVEANMSFNELVASLKGVYGLTGETIYEQRDSLNGLEIAELSFKSGEDMISVFVINGKYSIKVKMFLYDSSTVSLKQEVLQTFSETK